MILRTRSSNALELSEKKYHPALVLPKHADRAKQIDKDDNDENKEREHPRSLAHKAVPVEPARGRLLLAHPPVGSVAAVQ